MSQESMIFFHDLEVYIITTRGNAQRIKSITEQGRKFGFAPKFLKCFDVDYLEARDMDRFGVDLNPRAASCVLKHIEAQSRLLASDCNVALVLEDDAILEENFNRRFHKIWSSARSLDKGWLISLGGSDDRLDKAHIRLDPNDLVTLPISTAEAYLFDRESAARRIEWLRQNKICLPADHFLKFVDQECGNIQYRPAEPLCAQGSITGLFPTTIDENRERHSMYYLALRYNWRRFYRRWIPKMWAGVASCVFRK